jgi:hypothetical protein
MEIRDPHVPIDLGLIVKRSIVPGERERSIPILTTTHVVPRTHIHNLDGASRGLEVLLHTTSLAIQIFAVSAEMMYGISSRPLTMNKTHAPDHSLLENGRTADVYL